MFHSFENFNSWLGTEVHICFCSILNFWEPSNYLYVTLFFDQNVVLCKSFKFLILNQFCLHHKSKKIQVRSFWFFVKSNAVYLKYSFLEQLPHTILIRLKTCMFLSTTNRTCTPLHSDAFDPYFVWSFFDWILPSHKNLSKSTQASKFKNTH